MKLQLNEWFRGGNLVELDYENWNNYIFSIVKSTNKIET